MRTYRVHPSALIAIVVGLTLLAFFAAACGGGGGSDAGAPAAAAPVEEIDDRDEAADDHDDSDAGAVVFQLDATTTLHHWQALNAIRDGEIDDAVHHIEHILPLVSDAHLTAMAGVVTALETGALHDAEHSIELMLSGTAEANLGSDLLHLQMALRALDDDESDEAMHHVEHFVAATSPDEADVGTAILASLDDGHTADAQAEILVTVARLVDRASAPHVDDADAEEHAHEAAAELDPDADGHDEHGAEAALDEHEARTITVIGRDFAFDSDEMHVTVGETIRLVFVNEGSVLHDITAVGFAGEASAVNSAEHGHEEGMAGMDFHTAAQTGETTELLFVATEAGEFKLFCTVPGHEQLGMVGVLIVEEA